MLAGSTHDLVDVDIVEPGMVFCVDIGIYCEEWGIGFRLEDNCLVTEDSCENLTASIPENDRGNRISDGRRVSMEQLLAYMQKEHLDGMFISRPVNVKYVSHYTGEDSWLFITEQEKFFLTDPRYTEQVSYECPDYTILNWRDTYGSIGKALAYAAEKVGAKTIGFEAAHLTVEQYQNLQSEVKAELVPADGIIEEFRSIKRPEEIECLRISCDIASRAYEKIQKDIRVGITEKELAARLSLYMVLEGADTQPYGNILISGARTSLLHGIPSQKAIEYGDLVLMDYGCQYHGYFI